MIFKPIDWKDAFLRSWITWISTEKLRVKQKYRIPLSAAAKFINKTTEILNFVLDFNVIFAEGLLLVISICQKPSWIKK